jgi:protein-S-isoprenylcysteine O-methyltransferase Ste14
MRQFRAAGKTRDRRPSDRQDGLYARSRNPIYVSLTAILAGLGLAGDSLWVLGMVVPLLGLLRWGVIAREERYLTGKFGERYLGYRARVRRWL